MIRTIIAVLWLIGYIKCIIGFVQSDFNAPYKREIVYGVGIIIVPAGGIIGYCKIPDN